MKSGTCDGYDFLEKKVSIDSLNVFSTCETKLVVVRVLVVVQLLSMIR